MVSRVRYAVVVMLAALFSVNGAVAAVIDTSTALRDLRVKLDKLYASAPYRNSQISAKVISLRSGETLYERNADKPLVPASTTKLFSTATLYTMRGAGAELVTDVRVTGTIDQAGTLHGDMYIVGCGDALLSMSDIDMLADQIERLGIKRVTGSIFGDGSLFDGNVDRARYSGDNEAVEPLPPITALSLQRGSLAIVVSASRSGSLSVQPIPASDGIDIINNVSVGARRQRASKAAVSKRSRNAPKPRQNKRTLGRGRRRAQIETFDETSVMDRVGDAPRNRRRAQSSRGRVRSIARISASSSINAQGIQRIVVSGRISPGTSTTVYTSFTKPALVTAGVLKQRLRTRGITIQGALSERQHPESSTSIAKVSRPLSEFASIVNKKSDNYLAEHVFKMCGAAYGARPSNASAAQQCVARALDSMGVPKVGCVFNDGSGLSRRNQVSATTQVSLLKSIALQPWAQEFKSTLAIAGSDGTIRRRLTGTYAANNVHAKTGTLRNVSALAGYVVTRDGEPLAFSFISNGNSVSSYKYTEDMAALILASFSRSAAGNGPMPVIQQSIIDEDSIDPAGSGQ
ncbi:MAG: D-alanyl-D-alanine carboxypeptidase/D-alanyl-D-alanine-endopeptidase [Ignavibacteria bacterium]